MIFCFDRSHIQALQRKLVNVGGGVYSVPGHTARYGVRSARGGQVHVLLGHVKGFGAARKAAGRMGVFVGGQAYGHQGNDIGAGIGIGALQQTS